MRRRPRFRTVQLASECPGQRIDDERALSRTAHAGDAHEQSERDLDVDVLQIVRRRTGELQHARLVRLCAVAAGTGIDSRPDKKRARQR